MTKANESGKRCYRTPGAISAFRAESLNNIRAQLKVLLRDVFSLYAKTSGFQSHMAGLYSPDYGRLLEDQADQILAMTRGIVARLRNVGGKAVAQEVEHIGKKTRSTEPASMLRELREGNAALIMQMIQLYDLCDDTNDLETADLLRLWIDETQRRVWFLGDCNENRKAAIVQ